MNLQLDTFYFCERSDFPILEDVAPFNRHRFLVITLLKKDFDDICFYVVMDVFVSVEVVR